MRILVDTPSSKLPLKPGLVLGLLVLLAHLGLLQSMPLSLGPGKTTADSVLSFSTRAIDLQPAQEPTPGKPASLSAVRPKVRMAPRPTPESIRSESSTAPSAEGQQAGDLGSGVESEVSAATSGAVPALAPDFSAPPVPETFEAPPAPRPPRTRAPNFQAAGLAESTRLMYRVHANKFPFTLNGELVWRNLGSRYAVKLSYSAFGLSRTQTSHGQISENGLAPERFSDKYRSEVAAHFNYPAGKVTFSANTPEAPLLTGAQDRLSVLVQLGALVASEPERYGPGMTLTIQTIGPRDADLWLFTFGDFELLELPGGSLQTIKLVRNPREPFDQKVEVWLAPKLGYLPARIRISETNGDAIDQQWTSTEAADVDD